MEEMYVKPGNQERGWNDPPQFSYGLQMSRGPHRSLLNKRAAPAGPSGAPPATPPTFSPLGPPPAGVAPPPLTPARPPPTGAAAAAPPRPPAGASESLPEADGEPDVDAAVSVLNRALDACRQAVKEQVCNDVAKRLRLLEDGWRGGRLSLPVRRRMDVLSRELQAGRWDAADKVHLSLMVDHVTEVSQWMVGIKRLIAETRNLSPELLEPLREAAAEASAGSDPDPRDPVQDPEVPDQDPRDPDQDPEDPDQDSRDPDQDPRDPVQDPRDPDQDPKVPVQDPEDPVQDPRDPVQDPEVPVQEPQS